MSINTSNRVRCLCGAEYEQRSTSYDSRSQVEQWEEAHRRTCKRAQKMTRDPKTAEQFRNLYRQLRILQDYYHVQENHDEGKPLGPNRFCGRCVEFIREGQIDDPD